MRATGVRRGGNSRRDHRASLARHHDVVDHTEGDGLVDAAGKFLVLGSEFDAPQGHIAIDSDSSHTNLWTRLGRVNAAGQFDVIKESLWAVKPDPYLVSH